MQQYKNLLKDILDHGDRREDRTGTGTLSVFGRQLRFEHLVDEFPLVTTKKVFWRGALEEMLWFLRGETNIRSLVKKGVMVWNDWPYRYYVQEFKQGKTLAYGKAAAGDVLRPLSQAEFAQAIASDDAFAARWGELGPVYGYQWRHWEGRAKFIPARDWNTNKIVPDEGEYEPGASIDQIIQLLHDLRTNPTSRRMIVQAWNPADTEEMAKRGLPPCHYGFQCYTRQIPHKLRLSWHAHRLADGGDNEGITDLSSERLTQLGVPERYLDLHVTIRSSDVVLGLPFNVAQYAFLDHLLAHVVGMIPGTLVVTLADAHIYLNHVDAAREQLHRTPKAPPRLVVTGTRRADPASYILDDDVVLLGYDPHPALVNPTPVAV